MSIFPFMNPEEVLKEGELADEEIKTAKEWAWDLEEDKFKLKDGKMYIVEKDEAIKIWIYKILNTPRFKYIIYNHDYGHDLTDFIGQTGTQAYIKAEMKRMVEEAVLSTLSDYVTSITNFHITIDDHVVNMSFLANTIYNEEVSIDEIKVYK